MRRPQARRAQSGHSGGGSNPSAGMRFSSLTVRCNNRFITYVDMVDLFLIFQRAEGSTKENPFED